MVEPTGGQSREGLGSVLVTPGGDVLGSADPGRFGRGTSRLSARAARRRRAAENKLAEQQAIAAAEAARRAAEEQAATQAAQQKAAEVSVASLRARTQLKLKAAERGRPFTRVEGQRFLKKKGTSIGELREATRAIRGGRLVSSTGESVAAIIEREEGEKLQTKDPSLIQSREPLIPIVGAEEFTSQPDVVKEPGKIAKINELVSETFIQPVREGAERLSKRFEKLRARDDTIGKAATILEPVLTSAREKVFFQKNLLAKAEEKLFKTNIINEAEEAFIKEFEEKPATQAATFAVGGVVGGTLKGVKLVTGPGKFSKSIDLLGVAVGGKVAFDVTKNIASEPGQKGKGKTLGAAAAGLLSFGAGARAGSRAVKFVAEPKTVIFPTRKVRDPTFREFQAEVIKGGVSKQVGTFTIKGEKSPPRKKIITTEFREFAGIKPKSVTIIPARKFTVKTPKGVVGEEAFFATEAVQRGRSKAVIISGKSKNIAIEDFGSLPKVKQLGLRRLVESKTGRPTSLRTAQTILPKKTKLNVADINTFDFVSRRGKPFPRGKRITRTVGVSRVKPLIKTPDIEVFTSETFFKDVTFPGARATGKTPRLTGTIIRKRKPISLDDFAKEGFPSFPTAKAIKKSRPSSTTQKQITKLLNPFPKPLIKASTPRARVIKAKISSTRLVPVAKSQFLSSSKSLQSQSNLNSLERFASKSAQVPQSKQLPRTKQLPQLKQLGEFRQLPRLKQAPRLKQVPQTKQPQKTKQVILLKQGSKLRRPIRPPSLFIRPRAPPRRPVTVKPPFKFDIEGKVRRRRRSSKISKEAVVFSPDFVSQIFKVRKKITKRKAREIALSGDPFRERPIPIFD